MTQVSIDMPAALQRWIESQVAEGRFVDAADYLRDLVRRDLERGECDAAWLRDQIAAGLASGVIDEEPEVVLQNIISERWR